MDVPGEELTDQDRELIEFARRIVDANTDGEYGVYTMGRSGAGGCSADACSACPWLSLPWLSVPILSLPLLWVMRAAPRPGPGRAAVQSAGGRGSLG